MNDALIPSTIYENYHNSLHILTLCYFHRSTTLFRANLRNIHNTKSEEKITKISKNHRQCTTLLKQKFLGKATKNIHAVVHAVHIILIEMKRSTDN